MKHISTVTGRPRPAQYDATIGQILTVIAGILGVLAQTLGGKEASS